MTEGYGERRTGRRVLPVVMVCLAVLVSATPALAAAPEIERFESSNVDSPDVFPDLCGPGGDVMGVFHEWVTVTTFYDADGTVRDIKVHVRFVGELTRLDTGKSLSDPGYFTDWIDPDNGEITRNGLVFAWKVPGEGLVLLGVGRVVATAGFEEYLFVAGQHDLLDGVDTVAVLCEALA